MLSVSNLSKTFHMQVLGDKQIPGCRDVSFSVPEGEFLALAGPSGKGKSTVLKCIYRTYLPGSGSIIYRSKNFGEVDMATESERTILDIRQREMGYVSQFLDVIPRVSALELVMEPIRSRTGASCEEACDKARGLLKRLAIPEELFDAYPATFSGGEQQRVNIARAIGWRPRLLLLDEPTASLDEQSIERVVELLENLRRQGTTMIGIFHDQGIMRRTADRIYQL